MQRVFPIDINDANFVDLECVPNRKQIRKIVQIVDPEFSSVCPKSGLPDYGRVILRYIPLDNLVELKSWKLYLRSFYGVGCFHEDCNHRIADEFADVVNPRWFTVVIDWGARGGLHTTTKLVWTKDRGYIAFPEHWDDDIFSKHAEEWNNS